MEACKAGCDFKLHGENCAKQCKLYSIHEQVQASCVDGCAMSHPIDHLTIEKEKPSMVMMPVQTLKNLLQKLKEKTESHVKSVIILVRKPQHHHQLDHLHDYMQNVPEKLHHMIHTQSKTPIIIFSTLLILLSILLTASIISICRKTSKHSDLSISTQELVFDHHHHHHHQTSRPSTPIKAKLIDV